MAYFLLFLMLLTTSAMADVYVVANADKSIVSISEADDAVLPQGATKTVLKNTKIDQLGLVKDTSFYKLQGNRLVVDNAKVQADETRKQQGEAQRTADDQARQSAIAKLKGLGLTDNEISAIGGK